MKKISIVNGKGGTGKTTIVRHLVYTAIERGIRVLVVDLDPQGNLTRSMLYRKLTAKSGPSVMGAALTWEHLGLPDVTENSSAHLLYQGKRDVNPMRIVDGAAMIGATPELEDVMTWPLESAAKARESLDALADQFDLCVIDTAPTMSNLVLGGMICADYVVIPTDLESTVCRAFSVRRRSLSSSSANGIRISSWWAFCSTRSICDAPMTNR